MAVMIHATTPSDPVFREPHAVITGVVIEVIAEDDGDHHLWVRLDDDQKSRVAVEFIPELALHPPPVGTRASFYGVFRWDDQHRWFEIHPVTYWEAAA